MALRPCLEPGCPALTLRTRCTFHERLFQRRRGTPTQRGYDWRYQRARRALLAVSDRCAWCRLPARADDPLTTDHLVPLAHGGGIEGNLVAAPLLQQRQDGGGATDGGVSGPTGGGTSFSGTFAPQYPAPGVSKVVRVWRFPDVLW